jgi:site-specific DNA-methyltransferase (adenine-specific)
MNAFDFFREVDSSSIDFVLLDPPFLLEKVPNVKEKNKESILFTELDIQKTLENCYRILKNNSDLVVFGHFSVLTKYYKIALGLKFKYITNLIWVKPRPVNFLMANKRPLNQHVTILVFSKNDFKYNVDEAKTNGAAYNRGGSWSNFYDVEEKNVEERYFKRFMGDVIYAPNKNTMKFCERTSHPTQAPEALISQLIRAFSYKNELICDPLCGSGTTLVCAKKLNRNFVGCDINQEYVNITQRRLDELELGQTAPLSEW